ncbi:MAG TPA: AraC family transcriptional regulator ligand-binding domain-containing protein [Trebonia sp.]|nr:AraC family transcriptional regulator ligand-binding domain-containing protein [Trebonia sp.]
MTGPGPERPGLPQDTALTSVEVARLLLSSASLAGADARQLAAAAEVPAWELSVGARMIPAALVARLWELLEQATGDPHLGLTVARRHAFGDFGLYDYLITTSATLRDGMSAAAEYLHLVTTAGRLEVAAENGGAVTYAYHCPEPGSRGEELCLQFVVAAFCSGARVVTARQVAPTHIALPQRPPRSAEAFAAALGTRSIDFGAAAAMVTFRDADLDMPLPTADPLLAEILARYAAVFPAPPPVTWYERFQQLLDEALDAASPSLGVMARQLTMSARTLQRRLADHGTTWREELDAARRRRAASAGLVGGPDAVRLARQLRYADPRSVRRALRRWSGQA